MRTYAAGIGKAPKSLPHCSLRCIALFIAVVVACQAKGTGFGMTAAAPGQTRGATPVPARDVHITPVQGPSWLRHLGRPMDESSMGQTGLWGPSPIQEQGAAPFSLNMRVEDSMVVTGADLYRFSCRACHGERAEGVPPEINSMINPVQATSPDLILARMKKSGAPVSAAVAKQLATQAKRSLLDRIHKGGENMPAFPHLTSLEVAALVAYLDQLVGVPGAENKQMTLEMPALHVGEDVVKGTCRICHGATGPNPSPDEMLQGTIPPLAVLGQRLDVQQFVQKVTVGRPIIMGNLDLQYRGRMPVFYYLKPDEVVAAYSYLHNYPPVAAHLQNPGPATAAGKDLAAMH